MFPSPVKLTGSGRQALLKYPTMVVIVQFSGTKNVQLANSKVEFGLLSAKVKVPLPGVVKGRIPGSELEPNPTRVKYCERPSGYVV